MWLYIWLIVTAVAFIIEMMTTDMVTIWFAGGGLVAMILTAVGLSWYITLPVFIAVSLVLMLCFRDLVIKYLNKGEQRTNADRAFEKAYELLTPITKVAPGTIKVHGVVWDAVTKDGTEIPEGEWVIAKELVGNKYVVERK